MQNERIAWGISAGLAIALAYLAGSGFQANTLKVGTVDMDRVFSDAEYRKKLDNELRELQASRRATFSFLSAYPMLNQADLLKFRDLSVKSPQTDADRAEIERLRQQAVLADQRYRELQTKPTKTDAEKTQFDTYQRNVQENSGVIRQVVNEFELEAQERTIKLTEEMRSKVREIVADLAGKQGYTIVFSNGSAPYAGSDLTADALKAINAKYK
jgi:Skp family chaperone for outer membrane proteins